MPQLHDAPVLKTRIAKAFQHVDRERLRVEVRELSEISPWRSLAEIAFDWTVIAAAMGLALYQGHWAVWIFAAFIIATRQHALLIMMHEAAHYRVMRIRFANEMVAEICCAWPLLVRTDDYRQNHMAHHDHLNEDLDPDWVRKRDREDWRFPKSGWGLARLLFWDMMGGGFIDNIRSMRHVRKSNRIRSSQRISSLGAWSNSRWVLYAMVGLAVALTGCYALLGVWLGAMVTFLPVILRIRSIAEHFALPSSHELNSSRNYFGTWLERFCFAPHLIGYHLDHHLFPSVPFYNLPQLHECLLGDPWYAEHAHITGTISGFETNSLLSEIVRSA